MNMELFKKNLMRALENTSGDVRMLSDLQLVYMVPRNSTQLLNINTIKFQVERASQSNGLLYRPMKKRSWMVNCRVVTI